MIKRIFDLSLSIGGFIGLSPLLIAITVAIYVTRGRPIFFRQTRPGLHANPFRVIKFCTMTNGCDADGCLLPDCDRLTRLGQWLRSSSLDELPELFNILKGDMSIVGPRPLLMQYLKRYTPEQARRHLVKPGLTGWAQVNGRNAITWQEKFVFDLWYVDNCSFKLDLKIIGMTIRSVLKREGISAEGETTMPEFLGSHRVQK